MSDSEGEGEIGIFQEPDDYYQPEKQPTFEKHRLLDGRELNLRLVGHNPLWGHHLWNAGRTFASYIEQNATTLVLNKTVLELGAGAGLPSLTSAIKGASHVVVTDYPDADLIENLQYNIDHCEYLRQAQDQPQQQPCQIHAEGYLWGADTDKVVSYLPQGAQGEKFDVLILADLLFNHSEHAKLVASVQRTLKRSADARAYVFFTPYRPWLLQKDLAFFDLAREGGFVVDKIFEKVMDKVMFEEDPGDELLRRTVYGYELRWAEPQ
ncbi:Protein N-terminal and lysine N-methyltransferase efm7 [Zalaria obscura]|uniref:Protein N-terminal and lysine N-methyltransferase efm7 n=1 Tax=Zalaria obscura TaxID=2024903 RepID=A0ACC3SI05_9PEZI